MTGNNARCVLCIIGASPQAAAADDMIHIIAHRDIAAVVRDAPPTESQPTRQDLMEHLRLLERLMESTTVIPVEFGTIADSDEEISQHLLAARYDEWQALLAHLAGKVELGLKVLWKDMQAIFAEVAAESEAIRALRDRAAARSQAAHRHQVLANQDRIEVGRLVAAALGEKKDREAAEILEALAPLAVETQPGKLLGDSMILNAAFLVERERETEFDEAVSRVAQQCGARMVFRYVGPAPPFNFVGAQSSA